MELRTRERHRKYINMQERDAYVQASQSYNALERLYYMFLFWTGVRISESLNVLIADIELDTRQVAIESLKKGKKGIYRYIPLPDQYIKELDSHFCIFDRQQNIQERQQHLWTWSRMTASRRMKDIMEKAEITGMHATSRGLRHSFGISCAMAQVPTRVIQDMMGHADIKTTEIYTSFVGIEKREMVSRIW